jgi:hypothetical protein
MFSEKLCIIKEDKCGLRFLVLQKSILRVVIQNRYKFINYLPDGLGIDVPDIACIVALPYSEIEVSFQSIRSLEHQGENSLFSRLSITIRLALTW